MGILKLGWLSRGKPARSESRHQAYGLRYDVIPNFRITSTECYQGQLFPCRRKICNETSVFFNIGMPAAKETSAVCRPKNCTRACQRVPRLSPRRLSPREDVKSGRTEEGVGRQHQEMDRLGVRQVLELSGEQRKTEKVGCELICAAPTTLSVKG